MTSYSILVHISCIEDWINLERKKEKKKQDKKLLFENGKSKMIMSHLVITWGNNASPDFIFS